MREKTSFKWHSYFGVIIGFFILVAALTGSLISFYHGLDAKINPWQVSTPASMEAQPNDPLSHIAAIEAQVEGSRVNWISLSLSHESSWHYFLSPINLKKPIANNEVYVDPYTGEIKGMRLWGSLSQGLTNLMPFVYKLHFSLALGSIGDLVMGIAALLWLVVLFYGVWLTFPKGNSESSFTEFMARWKKSWQWRFKGNFKAKNTLLHKTAGLWFLPFLIILAWSSVSFNLHELHERVLGSVMNMQTEYDKIKDLKRARVHPKMGWEEARDKARVVMQNVAQKEGFEVYEENSIMYNGLKGVYIYSVRSSRDLSSEGKTRVCIDGTTGEHKASYIPTGKASGDTLNEWLDGLHKGTIWGLPHRIVLAILGVIITFFALSGYYLWWKRKKAVRAVTKK